MFGQSIQLGNGDGVIWCQAQDFLIRLYGRSRRRYIR